MIGEGEQAPTFELPAVVDGEFERIALEDYLGEEIVILAFYPGDFNPACGDETTDLDELDLFTMQKDVSILAVSGDSVHSHRAFADEYSLHIPLLSDTDGTVAERYGVDADADGYLTRRAIVVVDHRRTVEYTWVADVLDELPDAEAIRDVVEGIGGEETAEARYRVGHAHYIEGRRAFTSAMSAFDQKEWMLAQGDFERAHEEFDRAADEFNTAVRFGENDEALKYFERAERKAESLWRAAEWLSESASAFASGEGAKGDSMREDAETPLESARDLHEPPDPDDFPPEEDPAETDDDEREILLEGKDRETDTSLDADIDTADETMATTDEALSTDDETPPDGEADGDADQTSIDEEELEEIAAELEEQTEAAKEREQAANEDDETSSIVPDSAPEPATAGQDDLVDSPGSDPASESLEGNMEDDLDTDDIDLDLTDPSDDDGTETQDEETDEPADE